MAYIAWDGFGWDGEWHGLATVDLSLIFLLHFCFFLFVPSLPILIAD